jgi:uncharacterized repeat protein (TIGR03833 family)
MTAPRAMLFTATTNITRNPMAGLESGKRRDAIKTGILVDIIQKSDQRSGRLTRGRVKEILTSSATHPHGIKVRLEDGRVGRVAGIVERDGEPESDAGGRR